MTNVLFESVLINESGEELVDMGDYDFVLDPQYFKQNLADSDKIYLRKSVADKLAKIQQGFGGKYCFKIWDGYRPRNVQTNIYKKFWYELKTKNPDWDDVKLAAEVGVFVTMPNNPKRIPPHATGGAVDLTLVDKEGAELDMGTGFDFFGPEAASLFYENHGLSQRVGENRKMLREAMIAEDFRFDDDEWWHFDYGNQLWAASLNKPNAIYGEIVQPNPFRNSLR